MSVFFRTGEHTAASVSWPVYVFAVLPLQLLFAFYKALLYMIGMLVIGLLWVGGILLVGVRKLHTAHEEGRPPAA